MTEILLKQRQIFSTKRETLEPRLLQHLEKYQDEAYIIQCAVAIMLRNALCVADFSYLAQEKICSILLKSQKLASVRHLIPYFEGYFSQKDWANVKANLFTNEDDYLKTTEKTRLHIDKLLPLLNSKGCTVDKKHNLKAAFEDESGKLHTWNLSNVVRRLDPLETHALLSILGELTIFQKDGVRRFVRVVWLDYAVDEKYRSFDVRKEDDPLYQPKEDAESEPVTVQDSSEEVAGVESDTPTDTSTVKDAEDTSENQESDASSLSQATRSLLSNFIKNDHQENDTGEDASSEGNKTKPEKKTSLSKPLKGFLPSLKNNGQQSRKNDRKKNKNKGRGKNGKKRK